MILVARKKRLLRNEPNEKTLTHCRTTTYGVVKWITNPNEADSDPFLREALAMRRRLHAVDHPDLAESLNSVGLILQYRREYSAA